MPERYPDDATLLALAQDPTTGVEYIPTGRSPYFLEFRRLVQRTLLAAQRANDLRVYQDANLTVGVRPGRCVINNTPIAFAGASSLPVAANNTSYLWLDSTGAVQSATTALPADRTTFVPLACVTAATATITAITDLRSEAFLHAPSLSALGVTATASAINQAVVNGLGSAFPSSTHPGPLTASVTGQLIAAAPLNATVTAVSLSLGTNTVSTTPTDGVSATVKVNGAPVTTTDPAITAAAGTGFRSTAQGHGTTAVIQTDGTQNLQPGDLLTVDLTPTAAGTVSTQPADIVVTVRIDLDPP